MCRINLYKKKIFPFAIGLIHALFTFTIFNFCVGPKHVKSVPLVIVSTELIIEDNSFILSITIKMMSSIRSPHVFCVVGLTGICTNLLVYGNKY